MNIELCVAGFVFILLKILYPLLNSIVTIKNDCYLIGKLSSVSKPIVTLKFFIQCLKNFGNIQRYRCLNWREFKLLRGSRVTDSTPGHFKFFLSFFLS